MIWIKVPRRASAHSSRVGDDIAQGELGIDQRRVDVVDIDAPF